MRDIQENLICYILAGPNGSGKTTFAQEFLPIEAKCLNFVNADLIAEGLSPFKPENVEIRAARLMVEEIEKCVKKRIPFAFETTLSGRGYIKKIKHWKNLGYIVVIYYLKLDSIEQAIERVKLRVSLGGHNVPKEIIIRRFKKSWTNFQNIYKPLADSWIVFNTSGEYPVVIESSEEKIEGN